MLPPLKDSAFTCRPRAFKGFKSGKDSTDAIIDWRSHRFAIWVDARNGVRSFLFNQEYIRPASMMAHQGPGACSLVGHLGAPRIRVAEN